MATKHRPHRAQNILRSKKHTKVTKHRGYENIGATKHRGLQNILKLQRATKQVKIEV